MPNPYQALPPQAFWQPSVARQNPFEFKDIYKKKFAIAATDRVATAGSCFAQHIGRRLRAAAYNYLDAEPAPPALPAAEQTRFGYGIYSARFGNIYTVRQLVQLFDRAFGAFVPADQDWDGGGRYYDAFRPTVEPDGFGSREEMTVCRGAHLAAVRKMFESTDIFVFTLGLTEAWLSKRDGAAYPLCPGTAAGTYSPDRYRFHNFTTAEIAGDLSAFIGKLRAVRPEVRFLFTISPVSLVATASPSHVLVANTYSKSALRAVIGEIAQQYDFVDYFPSYDLLASHPMRAMFYEPNMREITSAGVNFVMQHFFTEHRIAPPPATESVGAADEVHPDDVACDELLLQGYARE